jgi:hypothetical protein
MNPPTSIFRCSFSGLLAGKEQRSALFVLVSACAVLALAGAAAAAEAPTRAEYVERLEAVCKPRGEETERAVKGVRGDISAERFKPAARKFDAASRIFGTVLSEIGAVPRPPADRPKLAKWFGYLDRQGEYLKQIAAALHKEQAIRSQRLTSRFVHNGNLANNVVLAFGFNYCSFRFSRFH